MSWRLFLRELRETAPAICVLALMSLADLFQFFSDYPFDAPYDELEDFSYVHWRFIEAFVLVVVYVFFLGRVVQKDIENKKYIRQLPLNAVKLFSVKLSFLFIVIFVDRMLSYIVQSSVDAAFMRSGNDFHFSDIMMIWAIAVLSICSTPFSYTLALTGSLAFYWWNQVFPDAAVFSPSGGSSSSFIWALVLCGSSYLVFLGRFNHLPGKDGTVAKCILRVTRAAQSCQKWILVGVFVIVVLAALYEFGKKNVSHSGLAFESTFQTAKTDHAILHFSPDDGGAGNIVESIFDEEFLKVSDEIGYSNDNPKLVRVLVKNITAHFLGVTVNSFVGLDANIQNRPNPDLEFRRTIRHELAHVFINRISDYAFSKRVDIAGSFFHEGLATLVENNWKTDSPIETDSCAAHRQISGVRFIDMVGSMGYGEPYSHILNYRCGYVFWAHFVNRFGQNGVLRLLKEVGRHVKDTSFFGVQYWLRVADSLDMDIESIFEEVDQKLMLISIPQYLKKPLKLRMRNIRLVRHARGWVVPVRNEEFEFVQCFGYDKEPTQIRKLRPVTRDDGYTVCPEREYMRIVFGLAQDGMTYTTKLLTPNE